ncbi:MAG: hypothetical protein SGJ04_04315 [Bacteroidota bacterium]|nr:hypothetical protein [Bacteroidota bacterium]
MDLSRLKSKLSKLNHDCRSPIATVDSFLSILDMSDYEMDQNELRDLCQSLNMTVHSGLALIDEVLIEVSDEISELEGSK